MQSQPQRLEAERATLFWLRSLSTAPRSIPRIKQRIRSLDMVAATRRARAIMDQTDSGRIAALVPPQSAKKPGD
jgi:phosphoenolpyruvate-protein kinase (PTS system EI component)